MAYFPFFTEIEGKRCLIAGGGTVAFKKARVLLDFGPDICIVAETMIPELEMLAEDNREKVTIILRSFQDEDAANADFVVAATSDEGLNQYISRFCKERKIPVNNVSAREECSFIFPAVVKEKDVIAGISTGGESPVIARYLKEELRKIIPSWLGELTQQLGAYREKVKAKTKSRKVRKEIFEAMAAEGIRQGRALEEQEATRLIERKLAEYEK